MNGFWRSAGFNETQLRFVRVIYFSIIPISAALTVQ